MFLENKLKEHQLANQSSNLGVRNFYSRDWETLASSCDPNSGAENDPKQWQTFIAIRAKLKEYNEALLIQNELLKLEQPDPRDLRAFRTWMRSTAMGNVMLLGPDSDIWLQEDPDHIALKLPKAEDPLYRWISGSAVQKYHQLFGHYFRKSESAHGARHHMNLVGYSDESIARLTRFISTIFACLLPAISVVILYFVDSLPKRLATLALLALGFSLSLLHFTNAAGGDIFVATASFTAVLVVFVGSTALTGTSSSSSSVVYLYNCTSSFSNGTAIAH